MSELKPCPFCGGTKICTEKGINLNYCDNCSAESNIEHWNIRPIEDALSARIAELERRAARAKELLQDEMGDWLTVEAIYMPDHYLQLKQTIDVLDGGGE